MHGRRACRGPKNVPERQSARRPDAEPAENHDRKPKQKEQRDGAADPSHAVQPSSARVLEHAARWQAGCGLGGVGAGHSRWMFPSGGFPRARGLGPSDDRDTCWDGDRPGKPAPPPRKGSDRRPVQGSPRRGCARAGSEALPRALQPGVPASVRRDAAPVSPHSSARTGRGAAPLHGSQRCGHLLHRGVEECRVVHLELRTDVRMYADRVPRVESPGDTSRSDPDLRSAGLGASEIEQFSRRQLEGDGLTSTSTC